MCRSSIIMSALLSAMTAAIVAPGPRLQVDSTSPVKSEGVCSVSTTRFEGGRDGPTTRVAMSRGAEELWALELSVYVDQAQATADGAAICIGLRPNGGGGDTLDKLELWHISKDGKPRRLDAIPCTPVFDTHARVPHIARLQAFESQQIVLLGLSHPRSLLFEGISGTSGYGEAPIIQMPNIDAPSEYWSIYSLRECRFVQEISPRMIFPIQARYLKVVGVEPMLGGEAALCTAVTSESLSSDGVFGLSAAVLDSRWRPVWQVWIPERWRGRPNASHVSIGGSESIVRMAIEPSAANSEFTVKFSDDADPQRYSVELTTNPRVSVGVREVRR